MLGTVGLDTAQYKNLPFIGNCYQFVRAAVFVLQDGMSAEIMALAQGHNETAELLAKLKPVSLYNNISIFW